MQEAMRTYLGLAMGLTEASRKKMKKAVRNVVGRSGTTADQVKSITTELLATNSTNRAALSKLVKFEVDRALGLVGLATAEEVAELTARVRTLEAKLREAQSGRPERPVDTVPAPAERPGPARVAKKAAKAAPRPAVDSAEPGPAAKAAPATEAPMAEDTTSAGPAKATAAAKATKAVKATAAAKATKAVKATTAVKATKAAKATRAVKATEATKATPAKRVTPAKKSTTAKATAAKKGVPGAGDSGVAS
jgi:polyhydroxyalkanoate synthesis regulator phasin